MSIHSTHTTESSRGYHLASSSSPADQTPSSAQIQLEQTTQNHIFRPLAFVTGHAASNSHLQQPYLNGRLVEQIEQLDYDLPTRGVDTEQAPTYAIPVTDNYQNSASNVFAQVGNTAARVEHGQNRIDTLQQALYEYDERSIVLPRTQQEIIRDLPTYATPSDDDLQYSQAQNRPYNAYASVGSGDQSIESISLTQIGTAGVICANALRHMPACIIKNINPEIRMTFLVERLTSIPNKDRAAFITSVESIDAVVRSILCFLNPPKKYLGIKMGRGKAFQKKQSPTEYPLWGQFVTHFLDAREHTPFEFKDSALVRLNNLMPPVNQHPRSNRLDFLGSNGSLSPIPHRHIETPTSRTSTPSSNESAKSAPANLHL